METEVKKKKKESKKLKTSKDIKKDFPEFNIITIEWQLGAKAHVVTFRVYGGKDTWEEVWKINHEKIMSRAEVDDSLYAFLRALRSSAPPPEAPPFSVLSIFLPFGEAECLSRSLVTSTFSPVPDIYADRRGEDKDGDKDEGASYDLRDLITKSTPMMSTATMTTTTGTPISATSSATTWGSGPTWEWVSAPDYGYTYPSGGYTGPFADSAPPPLYSDSMLPHLVRAVEEGKRKDVEMDTVVLDRGVAVSQGLGHVAMILGLRVKYAKEGSLPMDSAFVLLKDETWEKKEKEKEEAIKKKIRKEAHEEMLKIKKKYEKKEEEMREEIKRLTDLIMKAASTPGSLSDLSDSGSLCAPGPSIDFSSFDTSSVCDFSDSSPESSPASDPGVSVSSDFAYSKEAYDRAVAKAYEEGMEAGKEEKLAEIKKGLKKLPRKEPITRMEFDGELVWECEKKEGAPE